MVRVAGTESAGSFALAIDDEASEDDDESGMTDGMSNSAGRTCAYR